jgi:hypothetical protein
MIGTIDYTKQANILVEIKVPSEKMGRAIAKEFCEFPKTDKKYFKSFLQPIPSIPKFFEFDWDGEIDEFCINNEQPLVMIMCPCFINPLPTSLFRIIYGNPNKIMVQSTSMAYFYDYELNKYTFYKN